VSGSDVGLPGLPAARLWAATRFPYLANALFGVQVTATPEIATVAVDDGWRIHADPAVVAEWTAAQFGSVLIHHICHLLRDHGPRAQAAGVTADTSRSWTQAADAEINDDLVPSGLELPGRPIQPEDFGGRPGALAEQYFELTREHARPDSWIVECGSGADGGTRGWDRSDARRIPAWQAKLLVRLVAQDMLRHNRETGALPGSLLRWAQLTMEPVIDWRTVLAAELRRAVTVTAGAVDYSYSRPSRRASSADTIILPSLRRPTIEIAVVCDTSGSMSDDLLATALAEVEGLLRSLGLGRHIHLLAVDAAVHVVRRATSVKQLQLVGGGGTDMGAGIAAAAALKPRPAVVVVLTDGLTSWPERPPRGVRVIVGLLGDRAPRPPSWARVVTVPAAS